MNSLKDKRELTAAELSSLMDYCANNKWLKSDYAYCLHAMDRWNAVGCYPDEFKKDEVVARFREVAKLSYWKIGHFLTLKEFSISIGLLPPNDDKSNS